MSSLEDINGTLRRIENLVLRAEAYRALTDSILNRIGTVLERIEAALLREESEYPEFPPTLFREVQ